MLPLLKVNSLLLECTLLWFCIVSVFVTVVNSDLIDEVDQRPQIILRDGAMVFQSAVGKNIHFESNGGSVFLNEADLLELTQTVITAANTINSLHDGLLTDFENRLRTLERTVIGSQGIENRVSQIEQSIANGTSGADLPGNVDTKIKSLFSKVMRLTQVVGKIRTALTTNECSSNPCRNGGTCEDQYNSFICRCPPNWEGTLCDVDVNECAQFAGTDLGCQNGATCINRLGTYECQCSSGFFGLHCTRQNKECSRNNPQELCGHGICINQEGTTDGYTCLCDQGWTTATNSKACTQDVDECSSGKPACSKNPPVSCINLPGTFHCGPCPQGYTGNGYYCVDIDECQVNNGGCSMNPSVQCINTQGSRVCGACPPGYQGDGVTCTYLGACRINNGGCHPLAQCLENSAISQSYVQCICPSGYAGSGVGPSGCLPSAVAPSSGVSNVCQPNPCVHGTCAAAGNMFVCHCSLGYTGSTCNELFDPCSSNPCQNGGTCVRQAIGYYCSCSSQATGMHCEQQQMSCGGRLISESGVLKYPPSSVGINYPSQVSCGWLIITNTTQVLNVTFSSFNLEESPECSFDWLQIHDGHSSAYQLIGRYCGSRIPNSIISTHNVLYLWFRSDRSNQRDGFELSWVSIPPVCGGEIVFQSHGSLSSPGYPGKYPINRDCEWRLLAPNGKRIVLHFYSMNIENHSNCSFDFVEIRDGYNNRVVRKFCNSSLPEPITTPSRRAIIRFHSDSIDRDTGFQISFSTAPSSDCGGVLTNPAGTIMSPMDPDSNKYQHRATCEWVIQFPEGERIQIQFLTFSLENHRSCIYDNVEVHEGRGPTASLVGRYCGTQLPRPYTSNGNILTIIFSSDSSYASEGFKIKYQEVCGGIFGEAVGYITSPMYPTRYPRNKNCVYEIQQPLGRSITLNFADFELETRTRYSSRCYDSVEIRDGHDEKAPLLGKYCGTEYPPTTVSTYNYLWLRFRTDGSREYRGFYANYTTQDISCGGIIKNQEGTIQTPRYPDVYPNNHLCRWVIVADSRNVINLNWINFNLEGHTAIFGEGCSFDYVEVYENVTEGQPGVRIANRRFCGGQSPPNMTSTSNIVTVIFKTDSSIRYAGFVARYSQMDASNICSANFVSSTGSILSPGYPSSYPHNKDCTWIITVPNGQQILLNISDFRLERHSSCMWDYLEIRNGGHATSPLVGRFCGTEITTPIPSISNQMYLRFVTDFSHSGRGFNITWDGTITGCGGVLTGKSGLIVSPYYPHQYAVNTECFYKISTSQGSIVQIVFLDFDLESSRGCIFDYLAFYDGLDSYGKLLGKYCSDTHPPLIRSKTNNMFIKFKSDASYHGRGFSIKYDTVCDVTIGGFGGVIESPNFPNQYPNNMNCKWTIQVKTGNYINITFSHFMLERSDRCQHDYLQIAEGSTNQVLFTRRDKLCGSRVPDPINSSSNKMIIEMKTDDSVRLSGFRLEWYLFGCGGHFTDPSGEFTSPNYPNGYADNIECEWIITTTIDKSVELTIEDFNIESTGNCNFDALIVYGGPDANSPKLHNALCHSLSQPMKLTSSGNNMYLTFKTDHSYSGRGFKLLYKSVDSACGGIFVAPSGNIHSHNYPQNYDPHDDCLWYIQVEKDHVVQLTFLAFDLETSYNCTYDYVKLFDGNSTESPEIATLCGNNLPNITTYRSTGNAMVLRMKADGSISNPGFFANYTTACGARIVTEDYGTISVSHAINANSENQNCSWIIMGAQPQDRVTLTVTHMDLSPDSENSGTCLYGYLEVYEGEDQSSEAIGPFCGSRVPPHITSRGSALLLHLVSRYGFHYGYFSASYSVIQGACGGNLTSEHGTFASPEYPSTYPVNSECVWTLSTSPGNRVIVGFQSFALEPSDNCNKDYVEVRENDAAGNLIGVYCNDLPSNISAAQTLWIKFHSDSEGTASGFIADYSLLHGNELQGTSGRVASPLYPRPYLQESEYGWRVSVSVGSAIRITFIEFYIESYSASCHMYLAIYDGYDDTAPELMKACGTMVPEPITTSSNVVYIYMSTMGIRHGSLFLLEWLQVERTAVPKPTILANRTCGGIIYLGNHTSNSSVTEYILTSPGYPYGYRPGLNCEWIVQTPPLYHPVLQVTAMDVERSSRCTVDYLAIYSALDESGDWKHVESLCFNNASSAPPVEASNLMKVVFRTDFSVNGTGFAAKVYPACGGSINMPNGVIEVDNTTTGIAPNRYIIECSWNITVRPGRTIKILFDRFYIRNDGRQCYDLYLKLQNGHYEDSPPLGHPKYCGDQLPDAQETTSNHLSITYRNIRGGQGFKLRFSEVSVSCGGSYTLTRFNNFIEISSPNFPNSPPPATECIWTFMAPGGEALQVDFDPTFDFQADKDCAGDYVELRDGGTQLSRLIDRFCHSAPGTQRSTRNMLWVKYFTNIYNHPSRFKANVSIARCGGIIRQGRGEIRSPGYPTQYPGNSQCIWRIDSHYYTSISIQFQDLDLPSASVCNRTDHVAISEFSPFLQSSRLVQTVCGRTSPPPIEVSTSVALINFTSFSALFDHYKGFYLNFSSSYSECGGEMTTPTGEIKSPGYPSGTQFTTCIWTVTVPKYRRITVNVVTVDMDFQERHSSDLSFYNYDYMHFIDSLWRNRTLRTIESSGNVMKIYFYSRTNRPVRFLMRYSSDQPAVCGGVLQQQSGSISLPVLPTRSFYCVWEYNSESPTNVTVAVTFRNVTISRSNNFYSCRYSGTKLQVTAEDNKQILYMTCGNYTQPETVVSPFPKTKIIISQSAIYFSSMTFEGQYSVSPCGGILTGPEENLTSPGYPSNYPPNTHCAWAVNFPEDQRISVTFKTFQLEDHCSKDYVIVYNGPLPTSPQIGHYCGSNRPENIISQGNSLWIEFHSNADGQFKGFSINLSSITTGCGGIIHNQNRNISSPNYPQQYPPNRECEWEIRSQDGYFIQLQIVERFQLEQSDGCNNDFVEIFDYIDSSYTLIHKLCGRDVPRLINSTGPRMKIRFKSNENIQGDGFKAQWSPECGGLIENVTSGHIVSPGYPNEYGNHLNCNYTVNMPGHYIRAWFDSFNLEGGSCKFDSVTITRPRTWGSAGTLGPYCGTLIPQSFLATDIFSLVFKTDYSVNRSGFLMRFSSITACGGNEKINQPGTIVSPDVYMEHHYIEINCTWTISAPADSIVVLRFSSLFVNTYRSCEHGLRGLNIYDGAYSNPEYLVRSYCGNLNNSPPTFQSSRNNIVVEYITNAYERTNHFSADVIFTYGESVGCGGAKNVTTQVQTIRSPDVNNDGFYEPSLDCHWVLRAPENQVIRLQINSLQLKPCLNTTSQSSDYCACDYIEIHDGGTQYGELIGVYCGSQTYRPIISSSTELWFRFVTDANQEDVGFSIQVQAQQPLCSEPLLNVTSALQFITSQNYPNNYPADLRCRWILSAPRRYERIAIHIEDLNITGEADCSNSKLQISDDETDDIVIPEGRGSVVIYGQPKSIRPISMEYASSLPVSSYTFCGEVREFNYYSLTGRASLTFISNEFVARGFNISYSLAGCNRNYTAPQGRIHISGILSSCLMYIETTQNATISLYFKESYISGNCDETGVEIRDGATTDAPRLAKICGFMIHSPVFSTSNIVRIELKTVQHTSLDFTYTTTTQGRGCGGDIFNYGGTFTSPLYPVNYRNASVCQWNIVVPVGKLATLKFREFQIGPRSTCETDYVELIKVEMPANTEGAVTRYCGDDDPAIFVSTSNKLILRYTTSVHNAGTGWIAIFAATVPGQRLYDELTGQFIGELT